MRNFLYIGLNGYAGSGKDTVAKMLYCILNYNWETKEECWNKFKKVYKMDNNLEAENYVDKKIKDYVDKFKSAREAKEGDVLIRKVNEHGKHRMIRKETN